CAGSSGGGWCRRKTRRPESGAVLDPVNPGVAGAMRAAEEAAVALRAMADDAAATVLAGRGHRVDGALERVEGAAGAVGQGDPEGLVVIVAAHVASGHVTAPLAGGRAHCTAGDVNARARWRYRRVSGSGGRSGCWRRLRPADPCCGCGTRR